MTVCNSKLKFVCGVAYGFMALVPRQTWACAACYGQSDSAMAAGMNWGILSLLGMIVVVLGSVAGFFVFLARRSAMLAKSNPQITNDECSEADHYESSEPEGLTTVSWTDRQAMKRPSALAQQRQHCTHAGHHRTIGRN